jgi:lysylphosphatidylglycerol synthetase-like protein (DUF2156 family)
MFTNMVLNNLLVSLIYKLLKNSFYVMKQNICILLLIHVGTTCVFTLIKYYYINIDRGGVLQKHIHMLLLFKEIFRNRRC